MADRVRQVTEEQLQYVRDHYKEFNAEDFNRHFKRSMTWTYRTIKDALTPAQYERFKKKNFKSSTGKNKFSAKHKNYLLLHCDDEFDLDEYIKKNNLSTRPVREFCRDNGLIKAKRYHFDPVGRGKRDKKEKLRRQMMREHYQLKAFELCGL